MKLREMSLRQFAEHCDISPNHLSNILNKNRKPGLAFLEKLADGTGRHINDFINMLFPDPESISVEIRILAERIARLPRKERRIIMDMVIGLGLHNLDSSNEDE